MESLIKLSENFERNILKLAKDNLLKKLLLAQKEAEKSAQKARELYIEYCSKHEV